MHLQCARHACLSGELGTSFLLLWLKNWNMVFTCVFVFVELHLMEGTVNTLCNLLPDEIMRQVFIDHQDPTLSYLYMILSKAVYMFKHIRLGRKSEIKDTFNLDHYKHYQNQL
jgi:hypothetical protein